MEDPKKLKGLQDSKGPKGIEDSADIKDILKHIALPAPAERRQEDTETATTTITSDQGICPRCLGRGVIVGSDDVAVRCACMDIQQMTNRIKSARLSRELMKCRFEDFNFSYYEKDPDGGKENLLGARKAWQAARDFVDGVLRDPHHIGLLYTGQAGAGKTYLAASIANELIRQNRGVLFVVVPDLLDEMRATYDRKDVSEYDILDMAKTIPILILDDLGSHNYTDWTRNRIYSILNHRVNEKLPIIVTTNLHPLEINQHLGERTSSRLVQMCRIFRLSVSQDIRWQQYYAREKHERS